MKKTGTFSGKDSGVKKPAKPASPKLAPKLPPSAGKPPPPAGKGIDVSAMDLVKVEFDYKPENPDEIALTKGDFVNVLKREDGGWWEGEIVGAPGKKGYVFRLFHSNSCVHHFVVHDESALRALAFGDLAPCLARC